MRTIGTGYEGLQGTLKIKRAFRSPYLTILGITTAVRETVAANAEQVETFAWMIAASGGSDRDDREGGSSHSVAVDQNRGDALYEAGDEEGRQVG